jgi:hypothetical protein
MKLERRVIGMINRLGRERGTSGESATGRALSDLKASGEIISFHKTNRHSDKFEGIDFFIINLDGDKISLQVKSSQTGKLEHQKNSSVQGSTLY